MSVIFVYVTCADQDEAKTIAGELIERKLAACANIMQPHTAVYKWDGQIQTGAETAMILKTEESRFQELKEAVCAIHSYECPCIVALPVKAGHDPFMEWIGAQLR